MLPRELERRANLRFQARTLAQTGLFRNWREVENKLVATGRDAAPSALKCFWVRLELDRQCARAIRRVQDE